LKKQNDAAKVTHTQLVTHGTVDEFLKPMKTEVNLNYCRFKDSVRTAQ